MVVEYEGINNKELTELFVRVCKKSSNHVKDSEVIMYETFNR